MDLNKFVIFFKVGSSYPTMRHMVMQVNKIKNNLI